MRFHWYWPFARVEELEWAHRTLRDDEAMLIEVIDRDAAPSAGTDRGVTVVRDLPDVVRSASGPLWPVSRVRTYVSRASIRRHSWRADSYDLAHIHYVNRFTDVVAAAPCPLVMSVHDVTPHAPRFGQLVERGLLRMLYRRPDALVVHHRRLADDLVRRFRVASATVFVVPHQVFPVDIVTSLPSGGPPVLLMFGAIRPNKGYELLEPMMEHLASIELRLVVAGGGDAAIEASLRALALRDPRVSLELGFVPLERKRELFRAASIVLLPYTTFASQSGVLHDAYGHGRPVVVSDVGALGESVHEDGTGLVVAPRDPEGLATAVRRLIAGDEMEDLSRACLAVAADRSPEAVGRRLRDVYDDVLSSG